MQISVTVNGEGWTGDVPPRLLLVHFLRERLGLTGANVGCDTSNCGACTVLLDGRSVKSCTVLAVRADGSEVTTIEALTDDAEAPPADWHPLQRTFHEKHALQCGYCTPGMVMSAMDLIENNAAPTEEEIRDGLEGNLCRCTGYQSIVEAVEAAADELAGRGDGQDAADAAHREGAAQ